MSPNSEIALGSDAMGHTLLVYSLYSLVGFKEIKHHSALQLYNWQADPRQNENNSGTANAGSEPSRTGQRVALY